MSSLPIPPSVPGVRGRRTPRSYPNDTPSAPGNVPNRLSKVRFSLIRNTTCLIGQCFAGAGAAAGGAEGDADEGEAAAAMVVFAGGVEAREAAGPDRHAAATIASAIMPARGARAFGAIRRSLTAWNRR